MEHDIVFNKILSTSFFESWITLMPQCKYPHLLTFNMTLVMNKFQQGQFKGQGKHQVWMSTRMKTFLHLVKQEVQN